MLYLRQTCMRLALKLFRGEPAISGFDWNFSPIHTSSPPFSTDVGSVLHCLLRQLQPGLQSFEDNLHGAVNYLILPLFAFVNAGVVFSGGGELVGDVGIAVAAGLLFGKFAGIYFFTWLAIKIKLTPMPPGMTWTNLSGIALLGGIGFTVSLFIANLSFGANFPILLNQAKFGVLSGTILSGLLGYIVLWIVLPARRRK